MANTKETIYIDIDDEITGIIDKIQSTETSLVVLVLPKRAVVLQSSINIKLLKRAADEINKSLVLITSEASVLSLASVNNIYVAKDLTSKPEIPIISRVNLSNKNDQIDTVNLSSGPTEIKPIGELAKLAATIPIEDNSIDPKNSQDENQELDKPNKEKHKKDKSLKVPNFNKFRIIFFIVILLLLGLGAGAYYALMVLPKAQISIKTNASSVPVSDQITLTSYGSSLNIASGSVPAKQVSYSKTYTATVPTTGQQNNGLTASGTVNIAFSSSYTNCNFNSDVTIPSGAGISYNNLTYITQGPITVTSQVTGGKCIPGAPLAVKVVAVAGGSNYNLGSGSTMQVAPFSSSGSNYVSSDFSASSSGITGGTDSITQIVAQADINTATAQLTTSNSGATNALEQQIMQDNLYPLPTTLVVGQPTVTDSAPVGATASSETVSEVIVYTMSGVSKSDLVSLLNNSINSQISSASQSILNNGFNNLNFSINSSPSSLTMSTNAVVGPSITTISIKKLAEGKKPAAVISSLKTNPNITSATVKLSPFWVSAVPTNLNKIFVTIAKP